MKKIVHIVANLNRGGAELRILEGIEALAHDYIFAIVCCYKGSDEGLLSACKELGVEVYEPNFEFTLGKHITYLRTTLRRLKDESYSIVHSHTMHHSGLVMLIAYRGYTKRIAHARNSGSNRNDFKSRFFFATGKLLINVFATEKVANSKMSGRYLFGKRPFKVLLNCGDYSKFLKISASKRNLDKINLLCVARLDPIKNIERLLSYMPHLPNIYLSIVGSGQLMDRLSKRSVALKIDNRVNFHGQVENVAPYYENADVFILPSIREGLGGVVIEAQASGLHCVISSSIPEEVDFKLGLIHRFDFEQGSPIELLSLLERVARLKSPDVKVRERVIKMSFSMENEKAQYIDLYG